MRGDVSCESCSLYGWPVKGDLQLATCHSSLQASWLRTYSFVHGRQHSICCWDLCSWPEFGHDISVLWICRLLWHTKDVKDWCWPGMWCIDQFYTLFWILLESTSAYGLSWRSPSDENIQLETLGEELELAGSTWWGEHIRLWVLGQRDALALWGQWPYWRILLVWKICVMRCFGIVQTKPTSSSS